MNSHIDIQLHVARQRRDEAIQASARERLAQVHPSSLRRAVGRSIIRIGELVAAEPSLRPARSIRV